MEKTVTKCPILGLFDYLCKYLTRVRSFRRLKKKTSNSEHMWSSAGF
jgi:hypothetical protein